jgi:hypothetical protein
MVSAKGRSKDEVPELALGWDQGPPVRPVKSHTTARKLVFIRVYSFARAADIEFAEAIPASPCRASVNSALSGSSRTGLTFLEQYKEHSGVREPLLATGVALTIAALNCMAGHPKSVRTARTQAGRERMRARADPCNTTAARAGSRVLRDCLSDEGTWYPCSFGFARILR